MINFRKKTVEYLYLLPFIALFAGVLVVDNAFDLNLGVAKAYWFYIAMGPVIFATAVLFIKNRQNLLYTPIDLWIPIFVFLTGAISSMVLPTWQMKTLTFTLLAVLYFCLRIMIIQQQNSVAILFIIIIATGLIEAGWGLLQLYGKTKSQHNLFLTTGSFFNPGPYAGYLAVIAPIALYYVLRDQRIISNKFHPKKTVFYMRCALAAVTLACIVIVLPATMSRAAWLAAGIGCSTVYILYVLKNKTIHWKKHHKKIILYTSLAFLFLGSSLSVLYNLKKDSADGRLLIWKVAKDIPKDHPLGTGIGGFSSAYGEAQASYLSSGKATTAEKYLAGEPIYAFNDFLQLYIEFGPFFFFTAMAIIAHALYIGVRRKKIAAVGGLLALLTFASTSYPFSLIPFLIIFTFLISACVSKQHIMVDWPAEKSPYTLALRVRCNNIWIITTLSISALIYTYAIASRLPVYKAYKAWSNINRLYQVGAYNKVVEAGEKIVRYLPTETAVQFEYGRALHKTQQYHESNNILHKAASTSSDPMIHVMIASNYVALNLMQSAEHNFNNAIMRTPYRLYPHYLWANAYFEREQWDLAYEQAIEVLRKKPKIESPATQEMKEKMKTMIDTIKIKKAQKQS